MALTLGACESDFDKINTNPNNSEVAQPNLLLTQIIRSNVSRSWDVAANMDGGLLVVQHWAKIQYTNEDRYAFRTTSYQSLWDGYYAGGLQDANVLISLGRTSNNASYQGVGLVMRSWMFSLLTDIYGDIPYSQALQADKFTSPVYDAQQDVYKGLLADLKTASDLLAKKEGSIQGDILYNGDVEKWRRFANSLRLRLAMRIADADAATARATVSDVFSGDNVFRANSDNARLVYLDATFPNDNPIFENFKTRDDHRVSETLVTRLKAVNDPRLAVYADLPADGGDYKGVPNGLLNAQASALGLSKTSKPGIAFRRETSPAVLMTYAEVLFFKAEAIQRGFITGVAATEYNRAITASMNQYGITDAAAITAYLAQADVAYNPASYKTSIGNQKWIALYGQGLEAWSEWRRLDAPALLVARNPVAAAAGKIPVRFLYPAQEQSLNQANYAAAVSRQGADALTTKLWWDKF
ncbi:SusD/RagB family nutrient-binding outer membrane lipoprotein [Hymenobacter sp. 102]|uniref:SusD/RagB family nutrient-binding outer membrane lipoprotein n=1 Tax=Hymenobacter sp. 102 TaxID=3403152 RepID=UPI003CE9EC9D